LTDFNSVGEKNEKAKDCGSICPETFSKFYLINRSKSAAGSITYDFAK